MEKKMVKLTADTKVLQFLAKSSELVSKLPDWKVGVLEASSRPSNPTPRPPVTRTYPTATTNEETKSSNS
jgi:hypothetical protein